MAIWKNGNFHFETLLLFSVVNAVMPSPCGDVRHCQCTQNAEGITVYCEGVHEDFVLEELFSAYFENHIDKLQLSNCSLTAFPKSVFNNSTVSKLVADCPLEDIDESAFSGVRNLTSIILYDSLFATIPKGLSNAATLQSLELPGGTVVKLDNELHNLVDLQKLSIVRNRLKNISEDAFKGTIKLTFLNLAQNEIRSLHRDLFKPLKNLEVVFLSHNKLTTLEGAFEDLSLEILDISWNWIKDLSNALRNGTTSVKRLYMKQNPLNPKSFLPLGTKLPSLEEIDISSCRLKRLEVANFAHFTSLRRFRASKNKISTIPEAFFRQLSNITKIDLRGNTIKSVKDVFVGLPKLTNLHLGDNQINSLSGALVDLPSLRELNLTGNKIQKVQSKVFFGTPALRILHMANCKISHLERDTFYGLENLEVLNLSGNAIRSLAGSVSRLSTLKVFAAEYGLLNSIDEADMLHLYNLRELHLRTNRISNVSAAFRNLKKLSMLDLRTNRFTVMNRDNFPDVFALKEVWLGGRQNKWVCDCRLLWLLDWVRNTNGTYLKDKPRCYSPAPVFLYPFSYISPQESYTWEENCPENCTCGCTVDGSGYSVEVQVDCSSSDLTEFPTRLPTQMTELRLSSNSFTKASLDNSTDMRRIRLLDLSHNRITEVNGTLPPSLKTLELKGNLLRRLPALLFDAQNLENITLSENPWTCDCSAEEVRTWLLANALKVHDVDEIRCGEETPRGSLIGRKIVSLSRRDLCLSVVEIYVGVAIGTALALVLAVVYFRYRMTVKAFLYSRGVTRVKDKESEDVAKTIDAFLLFSEADREFASQVANGLESDELKFSVIVPLWDDVSRKEPMSEKLTAMKSCRRVVVILTRSFMNDVLCMELFHMAASTFCEEKVRRIIAVRCKDFTAEKRADIRLKKSLNTCLVIRWQESMFWQKLRYAMPSK